MGVSGFFGGGGEIMGFRGVGHLILPGSILRCLAVVKDSDVWR